MILKNRNPFVTFTLSEFILSVAEGKSPEVAARTLNAKKSSRLSGIDASFVSMTSVWKSLRNCHSEA